MRTVNVCVLLSILMLGEINGQPEIKSMAEAGRDVVFIYMGRTIVSSASPYQNISAYKVERKENSKNSWTVVGEFQAPASLEEFKKRFTEASVYFPQPNQDAAVPLEDVWRKASQYRVIDSIAPYNFYLPVMIALGYAAVDKTIKDNNTYQYRISHRKNNDWEVLFLTNKVMFPYRQLMQKPSLVRTFTDRHAIDITFAMPGKNTPAYFRVLRRDHFQGDFKVVPVQRFLNSRNDSLFVILHDTAVVEHRAYEYFLSTFNRAGIAGPNSDTVVTASYNFNEVYLPHRIKTRNQKGITGILISWRMERPELCRGLRLYRSRSLDKDFEPIADVLPTDTLYIDQHVVPMTRYYYHFRILGVLDESSVTSSTVFGLYQDQLVPLPPIYPEANPTSQGVRLTWSPGDEHIKGYYVYRSNDFGQLELISPLIQDTSYVDQSPGLSGRVVYSYALKAENTSHQTSNFSDTVQVRPGLAVNVQRPREVEARIASGEIYLSWLEMREYDDFIIGYEVERSDDGKTFISIGKGLEQNDMIDSTAIRGEQYTYRVRSLDAAGGTSDWSMEGYINFPAESAKLYPPPGLQLFRGENTITLRWGGNLQDGVAGYKIYRKSSNDQIRLVATVKNMIYEYTDKNIRNGERYLYYVTSYSSDNSESERSKPVVVTH